MLLYVVIHLLRDLGWVDFDLGVPPSCPAPQPLLSNSKQNWVDTGTSKISQPSQVSEQMNHPVALWKVVTFHFKLACYISHTYTFYYVRDVTRGPEGEYLLL